MRVRGGGVHGREGARKTTVDKQQRTKGGGAAGTKGRDRRVRVFRRRSAAARPPKQECAVGSIFSIMCVVVVVFCDVVGG